MRKLKIVFAVLSYILFVIIISCIAYFKSAGTLGLFILCMFISSATLLLIFIVRYTKDKYKNIEYLHYKGELTQNGIRYESNGQNKDIIDFKTCQCGAVVDIEMMWCPECGHKFE